MSDPVTNVQIEDVLSSIRRLVSEEIGQAGIKPLEPRRKKEDEPKLVLTPTQKIKAVPEQASEDLWGETQEMAPEAPAPVWWHRDHDQGKQAEQADDLPAEADELPLESFRAAIAEEEIPAAEAEDDALVLPAIEDELAATDAAIQELLNQEADVPEEEEEQAQTAPMFQSRLGGLMSEFEAPEASQDDEWEPAEGEDYSAAEFGLGEMPWDGDIDMDDVEGDEISEVSRARNAHVDMDAVEAETAPDETTSDAGRVDTAAAERREPLEDLEPAAVAQTGLDNNEQPDALASSGTEDLSDMLYAETPAAVSDADAEDVEADDIPFSFRPGERLFERLSGNYSAAVEQPEPAQSYDADPVEEENAFADNGLELDEDMLRDMVRDIVRQELQGSLGERITRNVRKLVRREIQRAFSDLGQ